MFDQEGDEEYGWHRHFYARGMHGTVAGKAYIHNKYIRDNNGLWGCVRATVAYSEKGCAICGEYSRVRALSLRGIEFVFCFFSDDVILQGCRDDDVLYAIMR